MTQQYLTLADLARYLGFSRPTVYKMMREPDFPEPVVLPGTVSKRWERETVDQWRKSAAE